MPDTGTKKKLTKIKPDQTATGKNLNFTPTPESKYKATKLRIVATVSWLLGIGCEIWAIFKLQENPVSMIWLIALIIADVIFVVIGSLLWKKANRFDPASEKEPIKYFVQNQLGLIVAILAFLPLVVLVFTNKNMDKKQKGIIGAVAICALLIAGFAGIDLNPPSQEQFAEQTARVEELSGNNLVYWTKSGTRYHLYADCHSINKDATEEIFQGSVAQARELKNITVLCKFCEKRAEEALSDESDITEKIAQ